MFSFQMPQSFVSCHVCFAIFYIANDDDDDDDDCIGDDENDGYDNEAI